jgi:anti-sigma B factor antagonist
MLEQDFSYSIANGAKDDTLILHLTGPFTLGNMFQLQSELRALKPSVLIMNLEGVPYMDSAGLGVIMNYYVSAQNHGRKFYLCGVNQRVRALLELTKVDSVLHLSESVEAAEAEG